MTTPERRQRRPVVLLRPVPLAQIEAIAHGGERMPPKSTFFNPKPSTGAVFMSVD